MHPYQGFIASKVRCPMVISLCATWNLWNNSVCEMSSKCFWCSSLTPRDILCVKTSLLFEETLEFSVQKLTTMSCHSFETLSFLGHLHTIAQHWLGFMVSSCSLVEIILANVLLLILSTFDVVVTNLLLDVILLKIVVIIDLLAALWSFVRVLLPIKSYDDLTLLTVTKRNSYGLGYHNRQLESRNQSFPI